MEWRARVHESERVQVYRAQRNMNSCSSHAERSQIDPSSPAPDAKF